MMINKTCVDAGTGSAGVKKALISNAVGIYRRRVAAKSVIDLGGSMSKRCDSAHLRIAGAFFIPAIQSYGELRRSTFGCVGFLLPRSANSVQFATLTCLAAESGGSSAKGAPPMLNLFALTLSEIQSKAGRHRDRAVTQLKSKSGLKVRHERYNAETARARFFDSLLVGGAQ